MVPPFTLIYSVTSGEDGSFVFSNVPAGEYTLYRRNNRVGITTPSHQMPITVKPGETFKVDYSIVGRAVTGQAMPIRRCHGRLAQRHARIEAEAAGAAVECKSRGLCDIPKGSRRPSAASLTLSSQLQNQTPGAKLRVDLRA